MVHKLTSTLFFRLCPSLQKGLRVWAQWPERAFATWVCVSKIMKRELCSMWLSDWSFNDCGEMLGFSKHTGTLGLRLVSGFLVTTLRTSANSTMETCVYLGGTNTEISWENSIASHLLAVLCETENMFSTKSRPSTCLIFWSTDV